MAKAAGKRGGGLWRRLLILVLIVVFVLPIGGVLVYRFVPPPLTALMLIRLTQGKGMDYRWRGLNDLSPALYQTAIASEDAKFCNHHGFDLTAMEKAYAHNEKRPRRIRGGSTISQQTAKNVFLWPGRSYVRKGLEAYFTVLIEGLWGKRRIMEVYLNVVEMGPGLYGAEAASQAYFHHSAKTLTTGEAARLIAILPDPLKYKVLGAGPYVQRRAGRVAGAAGVIRNDGLSACI